MGETSIVFSDVGMFFFSKVGVSWGENQSLHSFFRCLGCFFFQRLVFHGGKTKTSIVFSDVWECFYSKWVGFQGFFTTYSRFLEKKLWKPFIQM